ncbi:MarR family transcriptional regulator [Alteromonas sp. KUL156]|uniref:MarR family winged helix-turn-helix transcriptional regulator n=1 Tax=Alteromonas sp. KUL106 TaxID=2480799 RepID=UPI0012E63472|nr:MarR family transcriptional regulator [Alteromonas sp. KUL106]GFD69758.1 MarR family transcriptional regulator [Alteromonas sp. KUL106]GFD77326.1 MarR family transcriptional regulator [Tenacibaculum sp. KUL118]GFD97231.1 MarR family transcriptional regulator [Alteromonas sp. KUL154]GFE01561.1 MarR family transcriptional regulator [Alteromonas sp. KUL156]
MRKEEELLVALRRIIRAVDLRSKQLSKHVGLTGPQLLVMQNIEERPGIMVREIAENINLSPATITNILDRLESRDLATRIRSTQDKRKVGVYLTERGKEAVVDAPRPLQEHFVERFSLLKEWEQSQMVATVQRIATMMDAEDIDASPFLELGSISDKN